MKEDVFPKFKNKIKNFLIEERGNISKQKALSLGSFLGSISILSMLPDVAAGHTNGFFVKWSEPGVVQGTHYHHASHGSHDSHASHASHTSGCFLSGTSILTKTGLKKIEEVKIGDYVVTRNKEGVLEEKKVFKVLKHPKEENGCFYIIINEKIKITPNHPVYVNGKIERIENVRIGDLLTGKCGEIPVRSIRKIHSNSIVSYNIDTEGNRNYFADGMLASSGRLRNDFVFAGTKIMTPEGLKDIKEIESGENVFSYNPEKGRLEISKVIKKHTYLKEETCGYHFVLNQELIIGPWSMVFDGKNWKRIEDMKTGESIIGFNGKIEINKIQRIEDSKEVHNIEIEKNHNYFAENILLHNSAPTCGGCKA